MRKAVPITAPGSGWSFISFASETGFLGGAVVQANGVRAALRRAIKLGIAPGGEVICFPIPRAHLADVPADMRNRLLTEREVQTKLAGRGIGER